MSWQKDIGTRFELQITKRLNTLLKGTELQAVRIWYSGAGLREPFDVGVYRGQVVRPEALELSIEAKRTQGKSISLKSEWLQQIAKNQDGTLRHVIIFSVGLRNPVSMWVVRNLIPSNEAQKYATTLTMQLGKASVSINEKWVRKETGQQFLLVANGFHYLVEPFPQFYNYLQFVAKRGGAS